MGLVTSTQPSLDEIDRLWAARRQALQMTDSTLAMQRLNELLEVKERAGWPDFFDYAEVLQREAREAIANGQSERAYALARGAMALAPHDPKVYLTMGYISWAADRDFNALYAGAQRGLRTVWREEPQRLLWEHGSALLLSLLGLCIILGTTLIGVARAWPICLRRLRRRLPSGATRWHAAALVVCLMAVPLLFGVPLWIGVVAMLIASSFFLGWLWRTWTLLVLGMSSALPKALFTGALVFVYPQSPIQTMYLVARDGGAAEAVERMLSRSALTADECLVLAIRSTWAGDYNAVTSWVEQAITKGASNAELYAALGYARYATGDSAAAVIAYEKAIELNRYYVSAIFNVSRIYYAQGSMDVAKQWYERAVSIDLSEVDEYAKRIDHYGPQALVPPSVPSHVFATALEPSGLYLFAFAQFWDMLGGGR